MRLITSFSSVHPFAGLLGGHWWTDRRVRLPLRRADKADVRTNGNYQIVTALGGVPTNDENAAATDLGIIYANWFPIVYFESALFSILLQI